MSVPGNINPAPPPSSFDGDPDFFEENRWAKLRRKILQEPLIPLGCALTCWALYEATKSIRIGDKHRTNRMFRRRIYAQGFTIAAMVAGSFYWEEDRKKRSEYNTLTEEKRKQERRESWLRELEARDKEEDELRRIREQVAKGNAEAIKKARSKTEESRQAAGKTASSVKEVVKDEESGSETKSIMSTLQGMWPKW